jgi:hypothetical protein
MHPFFLFFPPPGVHGGQACVNANVPHPKAPLAKITYAPLGRSLELDSRGGGAEQKVRSCPLRRALVNDPLPGGIDNAEVDGTARDGGPVARTDLDVVRVSQARGSVNWSWGCTAKRTCRCRQ